MKIKAIVAKPRNPLVALASRRKAGTHRRSRSGERQRSRMALQRELPPVREGTADVAINGDPLDANTRSTNVTRTLDSLHSTAEGSMSRLALAHGLRAAASVLQRLADRMTPVDQRASAALTLPRLEFHGDAAAPEGALYVDGVLFGHLPGVHRL